MARIRSIHPGLFTDEAWVSCSPLARILVIGLWTDADDQGVFEWKPLQIKMRLLPGDAANVPELLAEIQRAGMVIAYEVDGKHYGAIKNFRRFQRPQKPNALHPLPESIAIFVGLSATTTEPVRDQYATPTVEAQPMEDGGGVEEKEGEASLPAATAVATEAVTKKPSRSDAQPIWLSDPKFTAAWNGCTDQMRKRSESREKTWPIWRAAATRAPSADALLAALLAYVRQDEDVKRTGGPGFHIWLKDGRWEHWLGQDGSASSFGDLAAFDAERARITAELERMEQTS